MQLMRAAPAAPLSSLVRCLWYAEGAPRTHTKERLLPNGESAIIFNLRDDAIRIYDAEDLCRFRTYGGAVLSGARSDCFVIDTKQEERVVGVQFRAGGAFPFLGIPAWKAANTSIALEDLWPKQAGAIREQLLEAGDPTSILHVLERLLLKRLVAPPQPHPAVVYALREFERTPHFGRVSEVIERIGLSSRRFIELFRRHVGLTPKVFCRVRRFQRVLNAVHGKREADWAQIALDCGYYDQAHFIHDFKGFSGLTPAGYLAAATLHLNHLPLV